MGHSFLIIAVMSPKITDGYLFLLSDNRTAPVLATRASYWVLWLANLLERVCRWERENGVEDGVEDEDGVENGIKNGVARHHHHHHQQRQGIASGSFRVREVARVSASLDLPAHGWLFAAAAECLHSRAGQLLVPPAAFRLHDRTPPSSSFFAFPHR